MNALETYDIIVCGAGFAGVTAATEAARLGCRVLIVEEEGYPGGSMTACGTGPMMTFHAGEKQVIRGITDELIQRLHKKGLSPGHTEDMTGYTYTVTPFSAEGLKREMELMMLGAGVEILYHTSVISARVQDGRLCSIRCFSCGQQFDLSAKVFIDATGDGDLFPMAGVPFNKGRSEDGRDQPMTMNFKVNNVNTQTIREVFAREPEHFLYPKEGAEKRALRVSFSGYREEMNQARADGEISFDRDMVLCFETNTPGEVIINMTRVNGEDPTDPQSVSRAETEGRRQIWEVLAFLKRHIPGFENAQLSFSGPRIGIRSSRRLAGKYTLTADDILNAVHFEDGIAACGYPIDIHSSGQPEDDDTRFLQYGEYYTIPYRCLLNAAVPNLLAAGRNISCSFEAQASTRLSPCCGAVGQAAGAAAALAVRHQILPEEVDINELRTLLRQEGAVVD